jgi:hypothetical protein
MRENNMHKYKGVIETLKTIALVAMIAGGAGFAGGIIYQQSNQDAVKAAIASAQASTSK